MMFRKHSKVCFELFWHTFSDRFQIVLVVHFRFGDAFYVRKKWLHCYSYNSSDSNIFYFTNICEILCYFVHSPIASSSSLWPCSSTLSTCPSVCRLDLRRKSMISSFRRKRLSWRLSLCPSLRPFWRPS